MQEILPKESAYGPSAKGVRPMNRLRRTPEQNARPLGSLGFGSDVRSAYSPEPPLLLSLVVWSPRETGRRDGTRGDPKSPVSAGAVPLYTLSARFYNEMVDSQR